MIVYVLTGVTLLIVILLMWRIAVVVLRRFDGSYEPEHQAPRPWTRSAAGAARAGRRVSGGPRRLPGATRRQQFIAELDAYQDGGLTYGVVAAPVTTTRAAESQVRAGSPNATGPGQIPWRCEHASASAPEAVAVHGRVPDKGLPEESDWSRLPPPELSHDAFRWPQRWHDQPAVARREATLGSLGAACAVLLTAAITAEAWRAEVLAPFPRSEPFANWLSDDTIARGELAAIKGGA